MGDWSLVLTQEVSSRLGDRMKTIEENQVLEIIIVIVL